MEQDVIETLFDPERLDRIEDKPSFLKNLAELALTPGRTFPQPELESIFHALAHLGIRVSEQIGTKNDVSQADWDYLKYMRESLKIARENFEETYNLYKGTTTDSDKITKSAVERFNEIQEAQNERLRTITQGRPRLTDAIPGMPMQAAPQMVDLTALTRQNDQALQELAQRVAAAADEQ